MILPITLIRPIALVLSLVLAGETLLVPCAQAQGLENVWAQRRRASSAPVPAPLAPLLPTISSRPALLKNIHDKTLLDLASALYGPHGTVREAFVPAETPVKTIVLVQDIHRNHEAQKNISAAIAALLERKQGGVFGLEGAPRGALNLEKMRGLPFPETSKPVADYLLEQFRITGPAHAALTHSAPLPSFVGVEDPSLYAANVDAVRRSAPNQAALRERHLKTEARLAKEKEQAFNPELKSFDDRQRAYRAGQITLGAHAEEIARHRAALSPALAHFLKAYRLEKSLDLPKVEQERAKILSKLGNTLSPRETEQLVQESAACRVGRLSQAEFYGRLDALCERKGVGLADAPAFAEYLRYLKISDSLNANDLLSELESAEKAAAAALTKTPREKELLRLSEEEHLKGKLIDFALTPLEWKRYAPTAGQSEMASFEDFYRNAEARNEAMLANTLAAMESDNASVGVLVAGGFHSDGLARILKEKDIAYLTFVPRVSKIDAEAGSRYLSVFTQEKTPLEKLFESQKLTLGENPVRPASRLDYMAGKAAVAGRVFTSAVSGIVLNGVRQNGTTTDVSATVNGQPVMARLDRDPDGAIRSIHSTPDIRWTWRDLWRPDLYSRWMSIAVNLVHLVGWAAEKLVRLFAEIETRGGGWGVILAIGATIGAAISNQNSGPEESSDEAKDREVRNKLQRELLLILDSNENYEVRTHLTTQAFFRAVLALSPQGSTQLFRSLFEDGDFLPSRININQIEFQGWNSSQVADVAEKFFSYLQAEKFQVPPGNVNRSFNMANVLFRVLEDHPQLGVMVGKIFGSETTDPKEMERRLVYIGLAFEQVSDERGSALGRAALLPAIGLGIVQSGFKGWLWWQDPVHHYFHLRWSLGDNGNFRVPSPAAIFEYADASPQAVRNTVDFVLELYAQQQKFPSEMNYEPVSLELFLHALDNGLRFDVLADNEQLTGLRIKMAENIFESHPDLLDGNRFYLWTVPVVRRLVDFLDHGDDGVRRHVLEVLQRMRPEFLESVLDIDSQPVGPDVQLLDGEGKLLPQYALRFSRIRHFVTTLGLKGPPDMKARIRNMWGTNWGGQHPPYGRIAACVPYFPGLISPGAFNILLNSPTLVPGLGRVLKAQYAQDEPPALFEPWTVGDIRSVVSHLETKATLASQPNSHLLFLQEFRFVAQFIQSGNSYWSLRYAHEADDLDFARECLKIIALAKTIISEKELAEGERAFQHIPEGALSELEAQLTAAFRHFLPRSEEDRGPLRELQRLRVFVEETRWVRGLIVGQMKTIIGFLAHSDTNVVAAAGEALSKIGAVSSNTGWSDQERISILEELLESYSALAQRRKEEGVSGVLQELPVTMGNIASALGKEHAIDLSTPLMNFLGSVSLGIQPENSAKALGASLGRLHFMKLDVSRVKEVLQKIQNSSGVGALPFWVPAANGLLRLFRSEAFARKHEGKVAVILGALMEAGFVWALWEAGRAAGTGPGLGLVALTLVVLAHLLVGYVGWNSRRKEFEAVWWPRVVDTFGPAITALLSGAVALSLLSLFPNLGALDRLLTALAPHLIANVAIVVGFMEWDVVRKKIGDFLKEERTMSLYRARDMERRRQYDWLTKQFTEFSPVFDALRSGRRPSGRDLEDIKAALRRHPLLGFMAIPYAKYRIFTFERPGTTEPIEGPGFKSLNDTLGPNLKDRIKAERDRFLLETIKKEIGLSYQVVSVDWKTCAIAVDFSATVVPSEMEMQERMDRIASAVQRHMETLLNSKEHEIGKAVSAAEARGNLPTVLKYAYYWGGSADVVALQDEDARADQAFQAFAQSVSQIKMWRSIPVASQEGHRGAIFKPETIKSTLKELNELKERLPFTVLRPTADSARMDDRFLEILRGKEENKKVADDVARYYRLVQFLDVIKPWVGASDRPAALANARERRRALEEIDQLGGAWRGRWPKDLSGRIARLLSRDARLGEMGSKFSFFGNAPEDPRDVLFIDARNFGIELFHEFELVWQRLARNMDGKSDEQLMDEFNREILVIGNPVLDRFSTFVKNVEKLLKEQFDIPAGEPLPFSFGGDDGTWLVPSGQLFDEQGNRNDAMIDRIYLLAKDLRVRVVAVSAHAYEHRSPLTVRLALILSALKNGIIEAKKLEKEKPHREALVSSLDGQSWTSIPIDRDALRAAPSLLGTIGNTARSFWLFLVLVLGLAKADTAAAAPIGLDRIPLDVPVRVQDVESLLGYSVAAPIPVDTARRTVWNALAPEARQLADGAAPGRETLFIAKGGSDEGIGREAEHAGKILAKGRGLTLAAPRSSEAAFQALMESLKKKFPSAEIRLVFYQDAEDDSDWGLIETVLENLTAGMGDKREAYLKNLDVALGQAAGPGVLAALAQLPASALLKQVNSLIFIDLLNAAFEKETYRMMDLERMGRLAEVISGQA